MRHFYSVQAIISPLGILGVLGSPKRSLRVRDHFVQKHQSAWTNISHLRGSVCVFAVPFGVALRALLESSGGPLGDLGPASLRSNNPLGLIFLTFVLRLGPCGSFGSSVCTFVWLRSLMGLWLSRASFVQKDQSAWIDLSDRCSVGVLAVALPDIPMTFRR